MKAELYIMETRLFKYIENFTTKTKRKKTQKKNRKFSDKKIW